MTAMTGPNYSVDNQIGFIVQWFRTWSELQKEDFVEVLGTKLGRKGNNINGLVNGMQKLDTDNRRVSLFSCQVKLFNEWWETWSEGDKENLTARLKDSDPKFWVMVEEEISGTRKKLQDDFFTVISTGGNTNGNGGGVTVTVTPSTNGVHKENDNDKENEEEIDREEDKHVPEENGQEQSEDMEEVAEPSG